MATKNWRNGHTNAMLRYRNHLLNEHIERVNREYAASRPTAHALYPGLSQRLSKAERGATSPLDGRAVAKRK